MALLRARRWVKKDVGMFVEETDANGNIVAKFYKAKKATKFWRSAWRRSRYSC